MTDILATISPYPGLRPFSEAESLYFKGRESHIASIQQELMLKRFLMVTGASGDGKSSLVYAGLLPNVRAGFLRSEFGKWAVAILRPGHIPMQNLSDAVSGVIKEKSSEEIKEQLKYGYSALANLYKQSGLFINKEDPSFKELDEKEQKKALRKGSNLLIVVDQFEEFFTSDNNFNKETALPGVEAMLVMNLLIETARLAKEQNLPIYIICTMRSDYIGNAPAYRGLPELIGNNQFFVPRLIREELVQVIEEPAKLNGNAISKRLVQRLINDLDVVNTDVLPSLQHGLRQIWEHAEKGIKEMDLFQYAQVGGMNSDELPENDKKEFSIWFDTLPVFHQQLIVNSKPGISNILNLHANLLYETAHEQAGISISKERSQQILKNTFQCLTQIDDSRAVRHRMTIDQIKEIAQTNSQTLNALLKIFRIQGNTLVFPFLLSEQDKEELPGNTLLDITHEALIRNWKLLLQWTQEEYQDVLDYRELDTAVQRWKHGGRKKEYLFSEGTYEHFSKRHGDTLPSPEWTKRYVEHSLYVTDGRAEKKLRENPLNDLELGIKAEENCSEIKEFFAASKKEIEATKKKRKRMLVSLALICVLVSVGFFWATSMWRKSDKLQKQIALTAKANGIATDASDILEHDPTLAFRLAEESYKIEPTPLNKRVIMASYAQMPFYQKLSGHTAAVNYAEFSPDGNYFITASDDNYAILWNSDGTIKAKLKHDGPLTYGAKSAMFSFDGTKVLTCSEDSTARLWDLYGKCLAILKHHGKVNSIQFSPDDKMILTASSDKTARVWDIMGKELIKLNHEKGVRKATFSPDGKTMLSISDKTAYTWDFKGNILEKYLDDDVLFCCNYSNNGKNIGLGDKHGTVLLFDNELKHKTIFKSHTSIIDDINFNKDGNLLLTASDDLTLLLWDLNGTPIHTFRGHSAGIWTAKFSNDGKRIISSSDDGTARLWDLEGNQIMALKGHTGQVISAMFSQDGHKVITASGDATARIWDIEPEENPILKGHTGGVSSADFSENENHILTSAFDFSVRVWSRSGKNEQIIHHENYYVEACKFIPIKNRFISVAYTDNLKVWDGNGKLLQKFNLHKGYGSKLIFNRNKEELIHWNNDLSIQIYSINDSFRLIDTIKSIVDAQFGKDNELITCQADSLLTILKYEEKNKKFEKKISIKLSQSTFLFSSISSDYNWMVTISSDSIIRVWDLKEIIDNQTNTKKLLEYINDNQSKYKIKVSVLINTVLFSPAENSFVTTSNDNIMCLWNLNVELISKFKGHSDAISDVNFSPDGKLLVSASSDKTVRLWDLKGNQLMVYTGHKGAVNQAKFSPDGNYILSASSDQTARLMPVNVEMVLDKINKEKVRGDVFQLSDADKKAFGIK